MIRLSEIEKNKGGKKRGSGATINQGSCHLGNAIPNLGFSCGNYLNSNDLLCANL